MSDVRGRNLLDAQDAIRALANNEVFYTGSTGCFVKRQLRRASSVGIRRFEDG